MLEVVGVLADESVVWEKCNALVCVRKVTELAPFYSFAVDTFGLSEMRSRVPYIHFWAPLVPP
jgi:hypothetical protein